MSDVKRYSGQMMLGDTAIPAGFMRGMVKGDDYDALLAENEQLRIDAAQLIGDIAQIEVKRDEFQAERDQLRAELAEYQADPSYATACETIRKLRAELEAIRGQQADAVSVPREELEALRRDKQLLDAIQDGCWDVRYNSSPIADTGDYDTGVEVIGHFMQAPHERILGEDFGADVRKAIAQAMTAEAYPPARPEYDRWGRPLRALLSTKNAEEV